MKWPARPKLVARNHRHLAVGDDLGLSIFVTPGPYQGYAEPLPAEPVFCMHTYPLQFRFWAGKYQSGQSLVTTPVVQVPAECWPPSLKCRSRMHYYLADRAAARTEPGAAALVLDQEGMVGELSTANLLALLDGKLYTRPRSAVLHGVSMESLGTIAAGFDIPMIERRFPPELVVSADEVLTTSTPYCLLPVTRAYWRRRPRTGVSANVVRMERTGGHGHCRASRTLRAPRRRGIGVLPAVWEFGIGMGKSSVAFRGAKGDTYRANAYGPS